MRYPQLLIYENDSRIAELFRQSRMQAGQRRFALREPRTNEACLRLLRRGGPSVFILKIGKDLVRELTLLERVTWTCPETFAIVVGDAENPVLADLAWDLGAAFVLFPPLPREWLIDIVDRLLVRAASPVKSHAPPEPEPEMLLLPESET